MSSIENFYAFFHAIKRVNETVAKPDLLKDPAGKNFRAISEAKILESINPVLEAGGIDYNIEVIDSDLKWTTDANGKILFIASCKVRLSFYSADTKGEPLSIVEALGMGIDSGDKALGKAYTYAVKYALLKKFRLLYSDDPDASASQSIQAKKIEKEKNSDPGENQKEKKQAAKKKDPLVTEKMTSYLVGLVKQLDMDQDVFFAEYGFYPDSTSVKQVEARKAIEDLKKRLEEEEELPF